MKSLVFLALIVAVGGHVLANEEEKDTLNKFREKCEGREEVEEEIRKLRDGVPTILFWRTNWIILRARMLARELADFLEKNMCSPAIRDPVLAYLKRNGRTYLGGSDREIWD